jgi:hypothetical protein
VAADLQKVGSMSAQDRANAGDGVRIIGRWHHMTARTGVAIFEAENLAAEQRYVGQWNAHLDAELVPVLDDEQSAAVARQIIADNNA